MYTDKQIHLIFKSHLDVGFTDLAGKVVDQYFTEFIPRAVETARALRGSDTPFVWITGAWLIYQFLEKASPSQREGLEDAIKRDEIGWHALPFTFHSESAGKEVFAEGLEFSCDLDRRFGKETCAAKMTDVPGHTLGIVPLLADKGVIFLHLGINGASHPVDLPPLFRWRHPSGKEVIVNYQKGYGGVTTLPHWGHALYFHHRLDNQGPPEIEEVKAAYADCQKRFPRSLVRAENLNRFARALAQKREELPVITQEMGDTWIHGVGTDPLKIARYRALCRVVRAEEKRSGLLSSRDGRALKQKLTLIPEHTWGLDLKTHLADYSHYDKAAFLQARQKDALDPRQVEHGRNQFLLKKIGRIPPHEPLTDVSYSRFEESWREQRRYIDEAVAVVKEPRLKEDLEKALEEVSPVWPDWSGMTPLKGVDTMKAGPWTLGWDSRTGALTKLTRPGLAGTVIASGGSLGLYEYEVFSHKEYDTYISRYIQTYEDHLWWALQDFTKCGLEGVKDLNYRCYHPRGARFFRRDEVNRTIIMAELSLPDLAIKQYGAPAKLVLAYTFFWDRPRLALNLHWRSKDPCRIPEAAWLRWGFSPGKESGWIMDKMDTEISPFDVCLYGNRALHGVESLRYRRLGDADEAPSFTLTNLDSPLLSPGRPRILEYDQAQPDLSEGFAVNLHNNLWGTNFPMWYQEDGLSRFILDFEDESSQNTRPL